MSDWIAKQSRFIIAIFLVLALAGGFALIRLPVSLFPQINFPRIAVSLDAGERPVEQMAAQVTRPVEEALRSVPGVRNIRSSTSRGSAEVSVSFNWGRDMATAELQAQAALASLTPDMPQGFRFSVRRMDPTIFPVLGYSLTSDTDSLADIKNFALYDLRPLLASVDGVAEVSVLGGREIEFQVIADPVRLQAIGLSLADIEAALTADNLVAAVGRIEDRSRLFLTVADDRLSSVDEIGAIVLKSAGGSIVTVDDVAEIKTSLAQEWTRVTADGHDAVLINIRQAPDANSVLLTDTIKQRLTTEAPRFPKGLKLTPYYDQSELVKNAAGSVRDAILIGMGMAAIVLFIFLRSIRFVLVVAILLPAVLAATALLMTVLGMSLNMMTLGGMAAAVGLVVDDFVVMLEHVTRRLADKSASALEAAAELSRPLIGSSLATIVVFTPLAFLSGVSGGFFKALAVTMASALVFSLVFTLAIAPLAARRFATADDAARAERANGWLRGLTNGYAALMKHLLRAPLTAALVIVTIAAVIGGVASMRVATGFMPHMDEGGFVLDYQAPPGMSLTETDRLLRQTEAIIRATPEVASYSRRTGLQLGGGLSEANEGDFFIRLNPPPRRGIDEVMTNIRTQIEASVPGLVIETVLLMEDLIGDLTAVPQPIEVKLFGTDRGALAAAADATVAQIENIRGVVEVQKADRIAGDSIVIILDRNLLALEGLDPARAAAQLGTLVGGSNVGVIQSGERTINIKVWTPDVIRDRVEALRRLPLAAPDGHVLPLSRVANIEIAQGQAQQSRENLLPFSAVTARLEGRDLGSAMKDVRKAMSTATLPAGVRVAFGGLYAEQQKSFSDLMMVFASAFVLAGLLLIFLFRSVAKAVAVLGVVGLSVAGVFAALLVTGTELNISAMMGLTMVIGIIAELGVFYFAELADGHATAEHHIEAGRARLRPIMMSALIAVLALSPLALKLGEGAALLAPMATAIIAGLIVGAPLVLIAAPVLHAAMTLRHAQV